MAGDRPNILYIFTDQQAATAMSCAGNNDLRTPAMDRLAESGVRFERAYCTLPLCSPSRASMLSGAMPHETRVTANGLGITDDWSRASLGHLFSAAGYECAYGGKWHLPEMSIPDEVHGFTRICGHNDNLLADRCIEFLRRSRDRPFLLVASFDNPHNICQWARQQPLPWGPVPDARTRDCPTLPANYAIPPFEPQFIRTEMAQFPGAFVAPPGVDDSWWRHYRHAYLRLVEKVDAEIGRILDALDHAGLRENTVIVFSSDHGEGAGAHQWKKKRFLYEEAVRVPLIVSWDGVTAAGSVDETHLVSNGLDLLPTLCEFAGIEAPAHLRGKSLRPLVEGRQVGEWRDQVVAVTRGGRMLRTQRFKYVVYSWGIYREQLTDLEQDPGEMVNLAVSSNYEGVLADHRQRLETWIQETGDCFGKRNHPNAYEGVTSGI